MTEMTQAEMDYYHMKKCAMCGQLKNSVDFPNELEPVVPGISAYCVTCATKKLEVQR